MDKDGIKKYICERSSAGVGLSKILEELTQEKGVKITYMELRLLASELDSVDWSKSDPKPAAKAKEISKDETIADMADQDAGLDGLDEMQDMEEEPLDGPMEQELPAEGQPEAAGKTVVELNRLLKPGMLANGSVKFASGASADWYLDQFGRIGLENASGKPDAADVQGFQAELQRIFSERAC